MGANASRFQFLSGTIKSLDGASNTRGLTLFQFLSGTIKRANGTTTGAAKIKFQFLSGTIKSEDGECSFHFFYISIPQWYN